MITKRNDKRTILRIGAALAVLLFMAALFVGAGAAEQTDWSSYDGAEGDYIISDISGSELAHKGTLEMTGNATLDFGSAFGKAYKLEGSSDTHGSGGLASKLQLNGKTLTIKNLKITGAGAITSGEYGVSGLFGRIETDGTLVLEDCTLSGVTLGSASGTYDVGGLVGYAHSASLTIEMKNCTIDGCTLLSGSNSVGGLVGRAGSASWQFTDCVVANCNLTGGSYVGGLVGDANTASCSYVAMGCKVECCNIAASGNYVGGLVGYANSASCRSMDCVVANCNITGNFYVGGLVGCSESTSSSYVAMGCKVECCNIAGSANRVGGLVGSAGLANSSIELSGCTVADCVIYAKLGYCGGIIGETDCNSEMFRNFTNNTVRNCLIYSSDGGSSGSVGGIIGQAVGVIKQTCLSNTVEYCTIVEMAGNKGAGGIAGKFPLEGTLSGNKVFNTCVVSVKGNAAAICPSTT